MAGNPFFYCLYGNLFSFFYLYFFHYPIPSVHLRDTSCDKFQFTLACIKMGRPELAQKAVELAEKSRYMKKKTSKVVMFEVMHRAARLNETFSYSPFVAIISTTVVSSIGVGAILPGFFIDLI
ncbi:hypothetical protein Cni_G02219 [Canna indica]|uniref:Uncharacterized protein n=1 Tax=Canna indica TaxID=4628 RepID=A0AAQ3JRR9_9LILI|nr:hypothetical protein Cni_G02219 [Canna indica]